MRRAGQGRRRRSRQADGHQHVVRSGAGTVEMVEAIVRDKSVIANTQATARTSSAWLQARRARLFVGVPCVLGRNKGIEKIIGFKLDETEQKFMNESISHVKDLVGVVGKLYPEMV